jgi:hypothetical protein
MSDSKISVLAEVATAVAAVTYPIVRVVTSCLERRARTNARRLTAAAAVVEERLERQFADRCTVLEERLTHLEHQLDDAA